MNIFYVHVFVCFICMSGYKSMHRCVCVCACMHVLKIPFWGGGGCCRFIQGLFDLLA